MRNILLIISLALVALISCDSNSVYREFQETENLEWNKTDIKSFTYTNADDTSSFDVYFAFRYAQGYQFPNALVTITEKSPQGETTIPMDFKVRNEDGTYIGDGSGDIWDIEIPIHENVQLDKGTYSYKIENSMPLDKVHMVMEVGIIIRKSVKK